MPSWTHLIRFIAVEDSQSHIGQLVDVESDVGLDAFEGKVIKAFLINGTIFDGFVTNTVLTVKYVSSNSNLLTTKLESNLINQSFNPPWNAIHAITFVASALITRTTRKKVASQSLQFLSSSPSRDLHS
jgi:hypothetical protein